MFSTDDEVAQIGTYTVPTETKTVTPKATQQVITPSAGKYLSRVTVNGDSDAVPDVYKRQGYGMGDMIEKVKN